MSSFFSLASYFSSFSAKPVNFSTKSFEVKWTEHTTNDFDGLHFACLRETNKIHCRLIFLASGLSSFQNGIRSKETPFAGLYYIRTNLSGTFIAFKNDSEISVHTK